MSTSIETTIPPITIPTPVAEEVGRKRKIHEVAGKKEDNFINHSRYYRMVADIHAEIKDNGANLDNKQIKVMHTAIEDMCELSCFLDPNHPFNQAFVKAMGEYVKLIEEAIRKELAAKTREVQEIAEYVQEL